MMCNTQTSSYLISGLHPRILTEGLDVARGKALEILESMKIPIEIKRENLLDITRTALKTKVILADYFLLLLEHC